MLVHLHIEAVALKHLSAMVVLPVHHRRPDYWPGQVPQRTSIWDWIDPPEDALQVHPPGVCIVCNPRLKILTAMVSSSVWHRGSHPCDDLPLVIKSVECSLGSVSS